MLLFARLCTRRLTIHSSRNRFAVRLNSGVSGQMARTLGLVTSVAMALAVCSCTDDVLDASYPSQADAVAAGAVKRGWIPSWIPSGATQLREVHNVDTNQSALLFNLPPGFAWDP